jgi:hypothetical protein
MHSTPKHSMSISRRFMWISPSPRSPTWPLTLRSSDYASAVYSMHTRRSTNPIPVTCITLGNDFVLWRLSICDFSRPRVIYCFLGSNILLNTVFSTSLKPKRHFSVIGKAMFDCFTIVTLSLRHIMWEKRGTGKLAAQSQSTTTIACTLRDGSSSLRISASLIA